MIFILSFAGCSEEGGKKRGSLDTLESDWDISESPTGNTIIKMKVINNCSYNFSKFRVDIYQEITHETYYSTRDDLFITQYFDITFTELPDDVTQVDISLYGEINNTQAIEYKEVLPINGTHVYSKDFIITDKDLILE